MSDRRDQQIAKLKAKLQEREQKASGSGKKGKKTEEPPQPEMSKEDQAVGGMLAASAESAEERVIGFMKKDPLLAGIICGMLDMGTIQRVVQSGGKYSAAPTPVAATPDNSPDVSEEETELKEPEIGESVTRFRDLRERMLDEALEKVLSPERNDNYGMGPGSQVTNIWVQVVNYKTALRAELKQSHPPEKKGKDVLTMKMDDTWEEDEIFKVNTMKDVGKKTLECALLVKANFDLPLEGEGARKVRILTDTFADYYENSCNKHLTEWCAELYRVKDDEMAFYKVLSKLGFWRVRKITENDTEKTVLYCAAAKQHLEFPGEDLDNASFTHNKILHHATVRFPAKAAARAMKYNLYHTLIEDHGVDMGKLMFSGPFWPVRAEAKKDAEMKEAGNDASASGSGVQQLLPAGAPDHEEQPAETAKPEGQEKPEEKPAETKKPDGEGKPEEKPAETVKPDGEGKPEEKPAVTAEPEEKPADAAKPEEKK